MMPTLTLININLIQGVAQHGFHYFELRFAPIELTERRASQHEHD